MRVISIILTWLALCVCVYKACQIHVMFPEWSMLNAAPPVVAIASVLTAHHLRPAPSLVIWLGIAVSVLCSGYGLSIWLISSYMERTIFVKEFFVAAAALIPAIPSAVSLYSRRKEGGK